MNDTNVSDAAYFRVALGAAVWLRELDDIAGNVLQKACSAGISVPNGIAGSSGASRAAALCAGAWPLRANVYDAQLSAVMGAAAPCRFLTLQHSLLPATASTCGNHTAVEKPLQFHQRLSLLGHYSEEPQ
jgi:hypothetical protein